MTVNIAKGCTLVCLLNLRVHVLLEHSLNQHTKWARVWAQKSGGYSFTCWITLVNIYRACHFTDLRCSHDIRYLSPRPALSSNRLRYPPAAGSQWSCGRRFPRAHGEFPLLSRAGAEQCFGLATGQQWPKVALGLDPVKVSKKNLFNLIC